MKGPKSRHGRAPNSLGAALALAALLAPICLIALASGGARADYSGLPTYQQAEVVDYGQALLFVGTLGWGGGYTPVQTGTQVYGASLVLVLYDLTSEPISVPLSLNDSGTVSNSNVQVVAGTATVDTLSLIPNAKWTPVSLTSGATTLDYSVATPVSFLPNSIANVGGLDLLAMGVVSQMLVFAALGAWAARLAMRRALWAPQFKLVIWGHVFLLGLLAAVVLDYQAVDSTFAGWSPFVYSFVTAPMFFLFALSLFNRTDSAIMLRGDAPLGGRMTYHLWELAVGVNPQTGEKVLALLTWRGFFHRLFGHYTPIVSAEEGLIADHFEAEIVKRRVRPISTWLQRARRNSPLDEWDVIPADITGSRKDARRWSKLYWTVSEKPVVVQWPRLSVHRDVDVPAKLSPEGAVLTPAHTRSRLTWPHYLESSAELSFAPSAWVSQQSVVLGWRSAASLAKVNSDLSLEVEVLKGSFEERVAHEVRTRLTARETLVGRIPHDLTEAEASAEAAAARNVDDHLRPKPKKEGSGA